LSTSTNRLVFHKVVFHTWAKQAGLLSTLAVLVAVHLLFRKPLLLS